MAWTTGQETSARVMVLAALSIVCATADAEERLELRSKT